MPSKVYKKRPLAERFWKKVDKRGPDDCWEWTAYKNKWGYGKIEFNDKVYLAHRIALYLKNGEMPPADKLVCHTCNNTGCVNPAHLYIGTQQDNMNDRANAGRYNQPRGELNVNSKLNEKKVRAIREIYALGNITHRQLGRLYDVDGSSIYKIINRKSWKHV